MNDDYTPQYSRARAWTYLEMIAYLRANGYEVVVNSGIYGMIYNGQRIGCQLITHKSSVAENLKLWVGYVERGIEIKEAENDGETRTR